MCIGITSVFCIAQCTFNNSSAFLHYSRGATFQPLFTLCNVVLLLEESSDVRQFLPTTKSSGRGLLFPLFSSFFSQILSSQYVGFFKSSIIDRVLLSIKNKSESIIDTKKNHQNLSFKPFSSCIDPFKIKYPKWFIRI